MLVFPISFIVLLVCTLIFDTLTVVVIIFKVTLVPVSIWMDLLPIRMFLSVLPAPDIEVIFSPVVESKPITIEVLLNSFLLVSVRPFKDIESISTSILKLPQGLLDVRPILPNNYLLPKSLQVVVFEFPYLVVLDALGLRV